MKKIVNIFLLVILLLAVSCKDKDQDIKTIVSTKFDISNTSYVSDTTIEFLTNFGQTLKIVGKDFELYIVLSDTNSKTFSITDTITSLDSGKARCIFKMNDSYRLSSSGTIEYDLNKRSGTFDIVIDDLHLINGKIITDTIIHKPIEDYTKISMTDYNAWPINNADVNDWRVRTDFDVIERLVFNIKTATTIPNSYTLLTYPNPAGNVIAIETNFTISNKFDFILVNENLEIEKKFMQLQGYHFQFIIGENLNSGDYFRFYYRIYSDTEQYFGSGDIKIEK